LHDAGNIYGREGHEKQAFELLDKMGELASPDRFEKRIIADLAEVHGGTLEHGDKDTIGRKPWKDLDDYQGCDYRPKLIAAIVRFADEICEDRARASRFLLGQGLLQSNEIYHKYSDSISSSKVDLSDKSVHLKIEILDSDAQKEFIKEDKPVFIIDEIFRRLDKMNLERMYCARYMYEEVRINRIKADICVTDDKCKLLRSLNVNLEDAGYPTLQNKLADQHPDWTGERLRAACNAANGV
jgi:hypothetical protein